MKKLTLPIYKSYYILEVEEKPLTDYVMVDLYGDEYDSNTYNILTLTYYNYNNNEMHWAIDKIYDETGTVVFDCKDFDNNEWTELTINGITFFLHYDSANVQLQSSPYNIFSAGIENMKLFCHFNLNDREDGKIYINETNSYGGWELQLYSTSEQQGACVGYIINSDNVYIGPWGFGNNFNKRFDCRYLAVVNAHLGCWEVYDTEHTGNCFCWRAFQNVKTWANSAPNSEFVDLSGLKWDLEYQSVGNMFADFRTQILILNNVNIGGEAGNMFIYDGEINNIYLGYIDFNDIKNTRIGINGFTNKYTGGKSDVSVLFDDYSNENYLAWLNNISVGNITHDEAPVITYPEAPII